MATLTLAGILLRVANIGQITQAARTIVTRVTRAIEAGEIAATVVAAPETGGVALIPGAVGIAVTELMRNAIFRSLNDADMYVGLAWRASASGGIHYNGDVMFVVQKGPLKGKAIAINVTEIPGALFKSLIPDFEAPNRERLRELGMNAERANILARFLVKHDAKRFIEQTAAFLHVPPAEVINWFNTRDPAWLQAFARHGIAFIHPVANGNYSQDPTPTPSYLNSRFYRVFGSIADMVLYAKTHGNAMPDRRGTVPSEVTAPPRPAPVPEEVSPPTSVPAPPGAARAGKSVRGKAAAQCISPV